MNEIVWLVYLSSILQNLSCILSGLIIIGFLSSSVILIGGILLRADVSCCLNKKEVIAQINSGKRLHKYTLIIVIICAILTIATVFIPSRTTMLTIVGIKSAQIITNTIEGQKVIKIIDLELNHKLQELQK